MFPGHKCVAMLVTGSLHCFTGLVILITAIVLLVLPSKSTLYASVAIVNSILILLSGGLGIAAGIKRLGDERVRQFKIAYMIICNVDVFNFPVLIVMYAILGDWQKNYDEFDYIYFERRVTFFRIQFAFTVSELILAIVSFSICCCCSPTPGSPVSVLQPPRQSVFTTAQDYGPPLEQLPPNTSITNETLQNGTMGYNPPPYASYPIPPNPNHVLTLT